MILWDLGLTLFDYEEILALKQCFSFFGGKLGPEWNKTVSLYKRTQSLQFSFILGPNWSSIWVKILKDFSNTVFFLLKHYIWSKIQQD